MCSLFWLCSFPSGAPGQFKTGISCSGSSTSDLQTCGACGNNGGGHYQCPGGKYKTGTSCNGDGGGDTQTCGDCKAISGAHPNAVYTCTNDQDSRIDKCEVGSYKTVGGTNTPDSCTTCGNGGDAYTCTGGTVKSGRPCNGTSTSDVQTCGAVPVCSVYQGTCTACGAGNVCTALTCNSNDAGRWVNTDNDVSNGCENFFGVITDYTGYGFTLLFSLFLLGTLVHDCSTTTNTTARSFVLHRYLVDKYCWERTNHVGVDGVNLETSPEAHTLHCLYEMSQCRSSGYLILEKDPGTNKYIKMFELDASTNTKANTMLSSMLDRSGGNLKDLQVTVSGKVSANIIKNEAWDSASGKYIQSSIQETHVATPCKTSCPAGQFLSGSCDGVDPTRPIDNTVCVSCSAVLDVSHGICTRCTSASQCTAVACHVQWANYDDDNSNGCESAYSSIPLENMVVKKDTANLAGAQGVTVFGNDVYVVAGSSRSLVHWNRNSNDGTLTP